jgi:aspartyl-tRNA(Asn)/glutamyl-tRNA(Gln) amidotransferase subunit A
MGKLATTQFASFDPPPTRNPWNLRRTPGGSSSGSAAAVASGMCLGALGTQTGGSVIRPASYCGVAGCKPTYGRVSVEGVVQLASSMDHVGPIAQCVHDLAIILETIAGPDPRDPLSADRSVPNYLRHIEAEQRPPRLARLRGLFEDLAATCVRELFDDVCQKLQDERAVIREVALPAIFAEVIPRHRMVMAVEAAAFHKARLENHRQEFGPNILALLEEGLACPSHEYVRSKEVQAEVSRLMLGCFDEADALIMPATTGPAPDAETTGDPALNSPWSYTGFPVVSIPAGWTSDKLPLAIQLAGRPWVAQL